MDTRRWVLILGLFIFASCKNDSSGDALTCTRDYEQTALLENTVNNIIIPSYQAFLADLANLQASINQLANEANLENLNVVKNSFDMAYISFQHASMFEFGPASEVAFRANLNNFPANVDAINSNLNNGVFDFNTADADLNYDKGFPALDYFLYGYLSDEASLLQEVFTNSNLRNYLSAIVENMVERTNHIVEGWDSYQTSFLSNQGTDAGSSLSQLINALNENYEHAKRTKLGDPAGVNALSITFPEGVEAFYSGHSIALLKASLQAAKDFYEGIGYNNQQNGEGLDDLLQFVNAQKEGVSLNQIIINQYDLARQKIDAITGTLATAIEEDLATVQEAYAEYSRQVLNTKTDMASILCISITYVDNPSDSD